MTSSSERVAVSFGVLYTALKLEDIFFRSMNMPSQNLLVLFIPTVMLRISLYPFAETPQDFICRPVQDTPVFPYFVMDTVHKHKQIDRVQWMWLPFFHLRKDLIRNLTDHFCRYFNPIDVIGLVWISRVLIPRAYREITFSSIPEISRLYLGISFGSNSPLQSLGASIVDFPYWF